MRSMAGVGITPPNVLGAPKPWSSVMMSNTLGAPFGGTTRGAHQLLESLAFSLIIPPNCGGDGGSCFPLIVVVAPGAPAVPLICWAMAADERPVPHRMLNDSARAILIMPHILSMNRISAALEEIAEVYTALA